MNYAGVSSGNDANQYQGFGGAGQAGSLNPPTPLRPIQEAMARQEQSIRELHEAISELDRRLDPVLLNTPATQSPQPKMDQMGSVHLTRAVELALGIEAARARIGSLLDRLQL